ncbi:MAG: queuosine precursor transporter [Bacteroidetes bacterium]|nr:MAG: queuosine precursor transporter [Bacteroidota bacterium]
MQELEHRKRTLLFLILGSFFICNALLAEFIGVKIFSLEGTLGIKPFGINLLGYTLNMDLTAGVLPWPFVFIMTDIINEYFGKRGVRTFSYIAAALIGYAFLIIYGVIHLTPASWWIEQKLVDGTVVNMQTAFAQIFGQGMNIIVGSLSAFMIGQLVDVSVFHFLKKRTGEKALWVRSTGSTLVSQLIDSYIVLFIAFYIGGDWSLGKVAAIGTNNYIYKFVVALLITPLLYVIHALVDRYLGKELSEKLRHDAHQAY